MWSLKVVLGSIVALGLTAGCEPAINLFSAPAAFVQEDVYIADPVEPPTAHTVSLSNEIGGEIVVIVGDTEAAITEAETHIVLTNVLSADGSLRMIKVYPIGTPAPQDRVLMHAQVPAGTILANVYNKLGDIELFGDLGNVAATTPSGDIYVMGANGDLSLSTDRGSIVADVLPDHTLTLTTTNGSITITARNATVAAAATNGSIKFNGNFHNGSDNQLTVEGDGSIHVALLDPAPYQVYATSAISQVITDFSPFTKPPSIPNQFVVCGFIHSSGYVHRVANAPHHFGRLEVTPALTGTHSYSGTLTANYYRFETNQTHVAFSVPDPIKVYLYDEVQMGQIPSNQFKPDPECQAAWDNNIQSEFILRLRTKTGRIQIHQMATQP